MNRLAPPYPIFVKYTKSRKTNCKGKNMYNQKGIEGLVEAYRRHHNIKYAYQDYK
ncbi:MAG: hypothetical protein L0H55_11650 [Candidatus Nitrosocosmicus sp.]|nr:hypothetical protein [Candidatus Nitrosocosmicus sp.]